MIVMKFGGTSVQDSEAIRNSASIIARERRRTPLVAVSACAGVTSALLKIAQLASRRERAEAGEGLEQVRQHHIRIAELYSPEVVAELESYFAEIEQFLNSIATLQELTLRTLDHILSYGERCSSLLVYHELIRQRVDSALVDARQVLITDQDFGKAIPLFKFTKRQSRIVLLPLLKSGKVVVTQGYIGSTREGIPTTLGRGGSDFSAAIFGSVLDAEEIQIWTDVEGILTADPSLLPDARPIPEMSFEEAAELAYFGAKVLHPSTILPAVKKDIPVRVLNSKQPDARGTLITRKSTQTNTVVKSIAYKENITVVKVQNSDMLMAHGFLPKLLEVFARHKKCIDVIATSLTSLSLTIQQDGPMEELVEELAQFGEVTLETNKAICCIVGEKLKHSRGIAARVFSALDQAGINVEMISHGGSDINLTLVIHQDEIRPAVYSLHSEFFGTESARSVPKLRAAL